MKFLFIDEFDGVRDKKLFGISTLFIDGTKYGLACAEFQKVLRKNKWAVGTEFKGSFCFLEIPRVK
jgi:hypothetical protein